MTIFVPLSTNYQSPLVAVPSRVLEAPREGNKQIPCEIDWGSMGGTQHCVSVNLQNNATLEFSQITAIKVDNSLCGASVQFIFPDTSETITIPAYTPDAVIEVFSNQTQFFVQAIGPLSVDITRFQLLNFLPPPVVVPVSVEQQTAIVGNISANAAAVTQIIANTVTGTLQDLHVTFGCAAPAGASNAVATFTDGTGKNIARCPVFVNAGIPENFVVLAANDIAVRFSGGVVCTVSGLLIPGGEYNVNAYYRVP